MSTNLFYLQIVILLLIDFFKLELYNILINNKTNHFRGDKTMHCGNCGRELMENEVCNCTEATPVVEQVAQAVEQEPVVEQAPVMEQEPAYAPVQDMPNYAPAMDQQPIYQQPNQQQYYAPAQPVFYTPYVAPKAKTDYPEGYKIKKKYIAAILAYILGVFGVHNFYLGNTNKGIAQLIIATVGSLFFGIGACVSAVWALVEFVQILIDKIDSDSEGYKLQTFAEELAQAKKDKE